ncbi:MAG TPA: choice-of-anchor tandem repeat GloVer-containing protein [Terriglobales bacterium]
MFRFKASTTLIVAFASIILAAPAFGYDKEKVLFRFNGTDGYQPSGALIFDKSGNLYGTTMIGGGAAATATCAQQLDKKHGCGVVFELSPSADGQWTETVLYTFCSQTHCVDGALPTGALIFDSAGNLYGTTLSGGVDGKGGSYNGVVYRLSPQADGTWQEKVLFAFDRPSVRGNPTGSLVFDSAGNLYGTTGEGVVFELVRGKNDTWSERILYQCAGSPGPGSPPSSLAIDASGNLYGTTYLGGQSNDGTVYELSPGPNGTWTESTLLSFDGTNSGYPDSGVILDAAGNLYGTTAYGGHTSCTLGCGVVFELTPGSQGQWTEKILRSFYQEVVPDTGLIFDAAGNLYGTTHEGGQYNGGMVFELSPDGSGKWTQTTLHSFLFDSKVAGNGSYPVGGLILDDTGNLYGVTEGGGSQEGECSYYGSGCGVVFELTP